LKTKDLKVIQIFSKMWLGSVESVMSFEQLNFGKYVRFEVFIVVTMKNAIFWDVASLQPPAHSGSSCGFFYPEDGGDAFLRNVGSHKIYTVTF
jgi:hypothetical protein